MPNFNYTAVSHDGKKMTGQIETDSEENARAELNRLGLSILEIQVTTETITAKSAGKKIFEFMAVDKDGKHIQGTASGQSRLSVYKKLKRNCDMTIQAVYDAGLPEAAKAALRTSGVEDLEKERLHSTETKGKWWNKMKDRETNRDKRKQDKEEDLVHARERVEMTIERVKAAVTGFGDQIAAEEKANINEQLAALLRVKSTSTNATNLERMCDEVLESVQEAEIIFAKQQKLDAQGKVVGKTKQSLLSFFQLGGEGRAAIIALSQKSYPELIGQLKIDLLRFVRRPKGSTAIQLYLYSRATVKKLFTLPGKTPDDEEIIRTKEELSVCTHDILNQMQVLLSPEEEKETRKKIFYQFSRLLGGSKFQRQEAMDETKNLFGKYKNLVAHSDTRKTALHEFKGLLHEHKTLAAHLHELKRKREDGFIALHANKIYQREIFWLEVNRFAGWLLAFYLAYYLASGFASVVPSSFWQDFLNKTHDSSVLRNIIAALLFLYSLLTIKLYFLREPSTLTNLALLSIGIASYLVVLINF